MDKEKIINDDLSSVLNISLVRIAPQFEQKFIDFASMEFLKSNREFYVGRDPSYENTDIYKHAVYYMFGSYDVCFVTLINNEVV